MNEENPKNEHSEGIDLICDNDIECISNCDLPWFDMSFFWDQQVGCCCYYQGGFASWDFLNKQEISIDEWWNGEQLQNVRRHLKSKSVKNTACEKCFYPKFVGTGRSSYLTIPPDLNEQQKVNWEKAIKNYLVKEHKLDSYPVRYYFQFGSACNLNCIMCCQKEARENDKRQIPVEPLLKQKKYLTMANEIFVIGGEPLVIPNARKFIENIISDPDYSNVRLTIATNATLLHNYIEKLKPMKKVTIAVSLDAVGKNYEYIRKGAKWDQVEKNLLDFLQVSHDNNLNWTVTCANLIMKSSIPSLVELSEWCIQHNISPHFGVLCTQEHTKYEDVFRFPELLDEIPHWKENFDQSIEKFRSHGWNTAANQLTVMRDDLIKRKKIQKSEVKNGRLSQIASKFKLFWRS